MPSILPGRIVRVIASARLRTPLAALALFAASLGPASLQSAAAAKEASPAIEASVVKIFSTTRAPDTTRPWSRQAPRDIGGSGVIIDQQRILTNAHVVQYAAQVQVQANEQGDRYAARVLAVAPEMDLALLAVEDATFFAGRRPIARSSVLPNIKDTVLAYGYPMGGTSISITKGIVSRVEFVRYAFPVSGLRIQIDAALNPGNSGGPVLAGDTMIGLAFSGIGGSQSIGYIIPNEEVDLFLKDVADGQYHGKWAMHDELQTLENPALRNWLKLEKEVTGSLVRRPYRSDAAYPLKEWDVITRIGDVPIDNQGMTRLGPTMRVDFRYHVQRVAKAGKLPLTIVRESRVQRIELPVDDGRRLLLADLRGSYPPYFIYGPISFSKASAQFLGSAGAAIFGPGSLGDSALITLRAEAPTPEREELVVISAPFFPHKLTNGYVNRTGSVVESVNGKPVRSLAHLVELLRDLGDEYVTFRFDQRSAETLVFRRSELVDATEEILTDNGIRSQGSAELLALWQKRGGATGAAPAAAASAAGGAAP